MTEGERLLLRFTLETFGQNPREVKQRYTATEWEEILIVARSGRMGADRRDLVFATGAQAVAAAMSGKAIPLKELLPVKFWRNSTEEEDAEAIEQWQ